MNHIMKILLSEQIDLKIYFLSIKDNLLKRTHKAIRKNKDYTSTVIFEFSILTHLPQKAAPSYQQLNFTENSSMRRYLRRF